MFFTISERSKLACSTLGVPDDWIMVYQSSYISHISDADDVTDIVAEHSEYEINLDDILEAVNKSTIDVELPEGWRLVGLRHQDGDANSERKYGFVDFTSLGAK
jgi:hypothetical protein